MAKQTNQKPLQAGKVKLQGKRQTAQTSPKRLKLLVTIVGRNKAEFLIKSVFIITKLYSICLGNPKEGILFYGRIPSLM